MVMLNKQLAVKLFCAKIRATRESDGKEIDGSVSARFMNRREEDGPVRVFQQSWIWQAVPRSGVRVWSEPSTFPGSHVSSGSSRVPLPLHLRSALLHDDTRSTGLHHHSHSRPDQRCPFPPSPVGRRLLCFRRTSHCECDAGLNAFMTSRCAAAERWSTHPSALPLVSEFVKAATRAHRTTARFCEGQGQTESC